MPDERENAGVGLRRAVSLAGLAALILGAWSLADGHDGGRRQVVVFAASSLQPALREIAARYEGTVGRAPPTKLSFSFASSSTLAMQVRSGAPAHLVITADPVWMRHLVEADAVRGESAIGFLANRLVVVSRPGGGGRFVFPVPAEVRMRTVTMRVAMGDPDHVPSGRYARQALEGMGIWEFVKDRVWPASSARDALRLVETGEADLGVVFRSDALASTVSSLGEIAADLHDPIIYSVAATRLAPHAAGEFMGFLFTPWARAAFERHGFEALVRLP